MPFHPSLLGQLPLSIQRGYSTTLKGPAIVIALTRNVVEPESHQLSICFVGTWIPGLAGFKALNTSLRVFSLPNSGSSYNVFGPRFSG